MREQLSFDLPVRTALGRDNFFVAPSNAAAVASVEDTENWPSRKLVLSGPPGSGKTHLAHVWAEKNNAQMVSAADLERGQVPDLANSALVVEDVPIVRASPDTQEILFHLHNLCLANGHSILLTGRGMPRHWDLTLPDLQSRMEGTQAAVLAPPDDLLLSVLLAKLFADRQITPKSNVIPYLIKRIDRSFSSAQDIVDLLDQASLQYSRSLTRDFVSQVLGAQNKTA